MPVLLLTNQRTRTRILKNDSFSSHLKDVGMSLSLQYENLSFKSKSLVSENAKRSSENDRGAKRTTRLGCSRQRERLHVGWNDPISRTKTTRVSAPLYTLDTAKPAIQITEIAKL